VSPFRSAGGSCCSSCCITAIEYWPSHSAVESAADTLSGGVANDFGLGGCRASLMLSCCVRLLTSMNHRAAAEAVFVTASFKEDPSSDSLRISPEEVALWDEAIKARLRSSSFFTRSACPSFFHWTKVV